MKLSLPNALAVLRSAYTPSPSIAAPTMMTLATPMITPSRVRKLRSLCDRIESIASPKALLKLYQEREKPGLEEDMMSLLSFRIT